MKKFIKYFFLFVLFFCINILSVFKVEAKSIKDYEIKRITLSGKYSEKKESDYKVIIRNLKNKRKLKKYINHNYLYSKKYIRELRKFDKKFFKKKAIIFLTMNLDVNIYEYEVDSLKKSKKKIYVKIKKINTLEVGQYANDVIKYNAVTYMIVVRKKDIKKINRIKPVIYME